MENISDRLVKYMEYKGLNPNKVTTDAGLSVGLIGKSIKSKSGLNSDTIEKILLVYEDICPEWFVIGKGEMLRDTDKPSVVSEEETDVTITVNKEQFLDMCRKVDYLFKLSLQSTAEKELSELRNELLK